MPGNRISLPVRVGCEIDFFCFFDLFAEVRQDVTLAADRDILRFVIMLHINAELALGKVTHMPVTGCYLIVRPQELLDRFDFGR